eukprot:3020994-Rhodomonas_salina.3
MSQMQSVMLALPQREPVLLGHCTHNPFAVLRYAPPSHTGRTIIGFKKTGASMVPASIAAATDMDGARSAMGPLRNAKLTTYDVFARTGSGSTTNTTSPSVTFHDAGSTKMLAGSDTKATVEAVGKTAPFNPETVTEDFGAKSQLACRVTDTKVKASGKGLLRPAAYTVKLG